MDSQKHIKIAVLDTFPDPWSLDLTSVFVKGMRMPSYSIKIADYDYPNASEAGIFGMLLREEADVSSETVETLLVEQMGVNYSFPLVLNALSFATRKYKVERDLFSIFNPFSFQVWLSVVLSSVVMTTVLYAFMQKKYGFGDILKSIISTIFGKSITFKHREEKLLMSSWLLGVTFLISCYFSLLFAAVLFPRMHMIRSIAQLREEIEHGRYIVLSRRGLEMEKMKFSFQKWKRIAAENAIILPDSTKSLAAFVRGSKSLRLVQIDFREELKYLDKDFYIFDDQFHAWPESFPVSSKFCCIEKLNRVVQRVIETGLLLKFEAARAWKQRFKAFTFQKDTEDAVKPLGLRNLLGAFLILACGYCAALLCLVAEILVPILARPANRRSSVGPTATGGRTGEMKLFRKQSIVHSPGASLSMRSTSGHSDPENAVESL